MEVFNKGTLPKALSLRSVNTVFGSKDAPLSGCGPAHVVLT